MITATYLAWYIAFTLLLVGLAWWPCCCGGEPGTGCEHCIDQLEPESLSVVLAGFTNDECTSCADYDGTYILPDNGACEWRHDEDDSYCANNWFTVRVRIFNPSDYEGGPDVVRLEVRAMQRHFREPGISYSIAIYQWSKDIVNDQQFDCENFNAYEVPFEYVWSLASSHDGYRTGVICGHNETSAFVSAV